MNSPPNPRRRLSYQCLAWRRSVSAPGRITRRHFTRPLLLQPRFDFLPTRPRSRIPLKVLEFSIKQRLFFVTWLCAAAQQLLFLKLPNSITDFPELHRIKLRQLFQNFGFTHGSKHFPKSQRIQQAVIVPRANYLFFVLSETWIHY